MFLYLKSKVNSYRNTHGVKENELKNAVFDCGQGKVEGQLLFCYTLCVDVREHKDPELHVPHTVNFDLLYRRRHGPASHILEQLSDP